MLRNEIEDVLNYYGLDLHEFQPIETGYINQTFKVVTNEGTFVLQRINPDVFVHSDRIIHNESKLREYFASNNVSEILVPIRKTSKSENFLTKSDIVWRLTKFIDELYSPLFIDGARTAFSLGKKLREFHQVTCKMDAGDFLEVIPGFHDLNLRNQQYLTACQSPGVEVNLRYISLQDEIEEFSWLVDKYNFMINDQTIQKIICHNDTKISNTLTDRATGEVRFLIDLDTIMPGYTFTDIGDAVRAGCSKSDESEPDESRVIFDHELFDAILDGYLSVEDGNTIAANRETLTTGAMIMLYMQALRFMADYLNGNIYYKVKYDEQNAVRARNQLILLRQLYQYSKSKNLSL